MSLDGLEELFGLVSTRRDPLSDGLVRGSSASQVRRWHLAGADWSADPACSSTSPDGTIHLTVTASGASQVSVEAYRDTARTVRIAAGHGNPVGPIRLTGDVVSGTIELTSPADSNAAELLAHPRVTVSRWQRLRDLWGAKTGPTTPTPGPR